LKARAISHAKVCKHFPDRAAPHDPSEGLPLEQDRAGDGVQARRGQKSWRRLEGHNQLPKVIEGVTFTDGVEAVRQDAQATAA
jgi:hypothetical protein